MYNWIEVSFNGKRMAASNFHELTTMTKHSSWLGFRLPWNENNPHTIEIWTGNYICQIMLLFPTKMWIHFSSLFFLFNWGKWQKLISIEEMDTLKTKSNFWHKVVDALPILTSHCLIINEQWKMNDDKKFCQ